MRIVGPNNRSQLALCLEAAPQFLLSGHEARAIILQQVDAIRSHWDDVCDEGGLNSVDRSFLGQGTASITFNMPATGNPTLSVLMIAKALAPMFAGLELPPAISMCPLRRIVKAIEGKKLHAQTGVRIIDHPSELGAGEIQLEVLGISYPLWRFRAFQAEMLEATRKVWRPSPALHSRPVGARSPPCGRGGLAGREVLLSPRRSELNHTLNLTPPSDGLLPGQEHGVLRR